MRFDAAMLCLLLASNCAMAADVGVHTMIAGDQVLEIDDTRQLTFRSDGVISQAVISPDGKSVAYLAEVGRKKNLCLVKSAGGRSTVVVGGTPPWGTPEPLPAVEDQWVPIDHLAWSPDSKSFTVRALRFPAKPSGDTDKPDAGHLLLVFNSNGALRTTITLGDYTSPSGDTLFSPDSRKIAATTSPNESGSNKDVLTIFDVETGRGELVYSHQGHYLSLIAWRDQRTVMCTLFEDGTNHLLKIGLVGGPPEVVAENYEPLLNSPDGRFRAVRGDKQMSIEDVRTGKTVPLPETEDNDFAGWLRNGLFQYWQTERIQDKPKLRSRHLKTLWLGAASQGKLNTICVALDCQTTPTWSADCRRAAYVSQSRLHLVSLTAREPTAAERMADGQPLTEEHEKQIMLENAKWIGLMLQCHICSYSDMVPSAETTTEEILDRFGGRREAYFRPGTEQVIFRYIPSNVLRDSDPEAKRLTIVGELDAGYDWKVVIYGDGRAEAQNR